MRVLLGAAVVAVLVATACGSDNSNNAASATSGASFARGAAATFQFVPLDAGGPITRQALTKGDIQIALLFTSDGAIAKNNWVSLEDDKKLQSVDNFVPAVNKAKATPEV